MSGKGCKDRGAWQLGSVIGEGDVCHHCLKTVGLCCAREESGYQVGSLGSSSFRGNAGASEEIIP